MHHQRPGEADALAHAAGELAGIRGLEPVQTDEVDRGQGSLADFRPGHPLCLESQGDVFKDGEPGKQGETLKHHRDTLRRARYRLAQVAQIPGTGLGQSRDQTQQGGFARTGSAEQADDLPLAQLEIHALQYQQLGAVRLRKGLADVCALQQR